MSLLENGLRLLEMWWVKPLGTAATATLSVAASITLILEAIARLLQTGNLAIASRHVGAADPQEAISAFCHTFILAVGVYMLLGPIGSGVARPLILLLGWEADVVGPAAGYIRIILLGSLVYLLKRVIYSAFYSFGDSKAPMKIMAAAVLANAVLAPALIYGWGPIPRLELNGAALAMILAQGLGVGVGLIMLQVRHRGHFNITGMVRTKLRWERFVEIARIGLPVGAQTVSRSFSHLVMLRIVSIFGTAAVAGYGVGSRVAGFPLMIATGASIASGALVGQRLGAKDPDGAERAAYTATGMTCLILAATSAVAFTTAPWLIGQFTRDPETIVNGVAYLRMLALVHVFVGITMCLRGAMNGAGYTLVPVYLENIDLWVIQIPVAFLLGQHLGFGTQGLWWGIAISEVVLGIAYIWLFRMGRWKYVRIARPGTPHS
ncbi:MAG: MATE family efflux transporter [Firmicutes bacterium]|jgi:putative MATE family efflux protein|nr:MATE family efflux transporter [Bacillota bacterium]